MSETKVKKLNEASEKVVDLNINLSGIAPVEFKVLVKQEEIDETIKTIKRNDGSTVQLLRPQQAQEKEQAAATNGEIVAVSPLAFGYEVWPEGEAKPSPGDSVIFAKYAGMKVTGRDGNDYLLVNDKDIAGIIF